MHLLAEAVWQCSQWLFFAICGSSVSADSAEAACWQGCGVGSSSERTRTAVTV